MIYEGCFDDKPQFFRGETGAQDSLIPACDGILDVTYPKNDLTKYLYELREYRPAAHQAYINEMRSEAKVHGLKAYAMQDSNSSALLLRAMHHTFAFRHAHWEMVKKYIMANTKYPRATGGTPITTWLPNQMGACLEYCELIMGHIKEEDLRAEHKDDFLMRKG